MIFTANQKAGLSKLPLVFSCQSSVIELFRRVYLFTAFAFAAGLA
jgi:hypothetical protein